MTKATSIKLDDDLKTRVKHLAEARRRSAHWIMREAIAQYVAHEEHREALNQQTLEAWEEFLSTGQHAAADEVREWLESWGTDEERPAPAWRK